MARKRDDALTRPHDIHSLLDQYDDGTVLDEINADIRSVTQAVARTGGKGEVTLTLKVSGGGDKRLKVAMSSKAKVPRFGHGPREVYLHDDGGLRDHHPEQKTLPGIGDPADEVARGTPDGSL